MWPNAVHQSQRSAIRALTHANGATRVQSVGSTTNPGFHSLIKCLGEITGVPVVLNTSVNVHGHAIAESPTDAIATFSASGMDAAFIGPFLIRRSVAPEA